WGKGFATEASRRILEFGFNVLNLNRIWAPVMSKNKASGKVMEKVGLKYEGTLKQDVLRWDKYEDVDVYGLLKKDFNQMMNNKQVTDVKQQAGVLPQQGAARISFMGWNEMDRVLLYLILGNVFAVERIFGLYKNFRHRSAQ